MMMIQEVELLFIILFELVFLISSSSTFASSEKCLFIKKFLNFQNLHPHFQSNRGRLTHFQNLELVSSVYSTSTCNVPGTTNPVG
jgi:hypothetical protein